MGRIFLVRYEGAEKKSQIVHDLPLNEQERSSAMTLGQQLASFHINKIFSSRCIRSLHTAQIIGQQQPDSYVLFSHREEMHADRYEPSFLPHSRCIWIYPEEDMTSREEIENKDWQKRSLDLFKKEILPSLSKEEAVLLVADWPLLYYLNQKGLDGRSSFQTWKGSSSLDYCSYSEGNKDGLEEGPTSSTIVTSNEG